MALSQTLRQVGINQGLQVVGVAIAQERQLANDERRDFGMSFTNTTMGIWRSRSTRRDWGPASIVPADLMCW